MTEPTITCPKCMSSFALTESLAAPLLAQRDADYKRALALRDEQIRGAEADITKREDEVRNKAAVVERTISERVMAEREEVLKRQRALARQEFSVLLKQNESTLQDLSRVIDSKDQQLRTAQDTEAQYKRQMRSLDAEKQRMALTIEEKVAQEVEEVRRQASKDATIAAQLRLREKDLRIDAMAKQIDILKQQAEQGPQHIQGAAQEAELVSLLREHFPQDEIYKVPMGQAGGDVVHFVRNAKGLACGTILWESKRTKTWSENWLTKLKDDQRVAKADIAIIVSQALPKNVEYFEQRGEVWVAGFECVIPVAGSLRYLLIQTVATRRLSEGVKDKANLVYGYVTSSTFKQRVHALIDSYKAMESDLMAEQRAIKRQWAKRRQQLDRMSDSTVGMWGDLEAIAGKGIPELEGIGFDALGAGHR